MTQSILTDADCEALAAALHPFGIVADVKGATNVAGVIGAIETIIARHSAVMTPVGKPNMVMRSLRVPEKLWNEAKAKADEREENISDVLREALERYVRSKR